MYINNDDNDTDADSDNDNDTGRDIRTSVI